MCKISIFLTLAPSGGIIVSKPVATPGTVHPTHIFPLNRSDIDPFRLFGSWLLSFGDVSRGDVCLLLKDGTRWHSASGAQRARKNKKTHLKNSAAKSLSRSHRPDTQDHTGEFTCPRVETIFFL